MVCCSNYILPQRVLLLAILLPLIAATTAAAAGKGGDADLVCSACRILADELRKKVEEEVASGRTVDSGSFRVDSQGNQRVEKIPYAKSDTHLTHVIESACHNLADFGRMQLATGQRGFAPLSRSDGKPVDNKRIESGSTIDNWLRMRCDSLLDDYEDEVKSLLRKEPALTSEQLQAELCNNLAGVCTPDLLQLQFEAPADETKPANDAEKAADSNSNQQQQNEAGAAEEADEKKDEL